MRRALAYLARRLDRVLWLAIIAIHVGVALVPFGFRRTSLVIVLMAGCAVYGFSLAQVLRQTRPRP